MIHKNQIRFLFRLVRWLIPPVLLFFIFRYIDFHLFFKSLTHVNFWLLALGLSFCPLAIAVAGIRWRVTLSEYCNLHPSLGYLVRHYWIGMALGFFSPGQFGADAYRVMIIGRRYRNYMQMVFAILIEKVMALLNAALLVFCLYPFVKPFIVQKGAAFDRIVTVSYLVALGALGLGGVVLFAARHRLAHQFVNTLSKFVLRFIRRMKGMPESETILIDARNPSKILEILSSPRPFICVFAASLAIQIISAAGTQIIFRAVGYDIPVLVNLFITPIFYFIFMLPVSVGSLGVREGAYILLYGMFGVPPETALLVSFINFSGILFNNAIGAVMIWGVKRDANAGPDIKSGHTSSTDRKSEE